EKKAFIGDIGINNDNKKTTIIIFLIFFSFINLFKINDAIINDKNTRKGSSFIFQPTLFVSDIFASASVGMYSPIDIMLLISIDITMDSNRSKSRIIALNASFIFILSIIIITENI
ncbi:hypothetical protein OFD71_28015, partial [Escherichia coli]|nr:hypothetical protein [Escherichia coli]